MCIVSATILDPAGNRYNNASVFASFVGQNTTPGAGPYLVGGLPSGVFETIITAQVDSFGNFAMVLNGNDVILPTPSQWVFAVLSQDGRTSFSVLVTIFGSTQNITSQLQAAAAPLVPVIGGTVNTSLVPSGDLTLALGTTSKRWNASLGNVTALSLANRQYADQFAGGDIGAKINAAITALGLISTNGGIVDATAFLGAQAQSTTVTIPAGVIVLLGPTIYQSTVSPAFVIAGTGAALRGLQQGSPIGSTPDVTSVIQAATGLTGPIVKLAINSGSRGGQISDLQIDGNNVGTVTSGLLVNDNTDFACLYERVTITRCPTGVALGTGTGNLQSQRFFNFVIAQCSTGIDASSPNMRDIEFWSCIIQATVTCFIAGKDTSAGGDVCDNISFYGGAMDTTANTATSIGTVRNVRAFRMIGTRMEADTPSSYATMLVLGTVNGGGLVPDGVSISNCDFEGDGNVSQCIELKNGQSPSIMGCTFRNITGNHAVKNTSTTGGVIIGCRTAAGSGGIVDSPTGLIIIQGNTSPANDLPAFPLGIEPATVVLTGNAPTTSTSQLGLGVQTATSASAGGNGAVPAQVQGYLLWNLSGVTIKVPFFNN